MDTLTCVISTCDMTYMQKVALCFLGTVLFAVIVNIAVPWDYFRNIRLTTNYEIDEDLLLIRNLRIRRKNVILGNPSEDDLGHFLGGKSSNETQQLIRDSIASSSHEKSNSNLHENSTGLNSKPNKEKGKKKHTKKKAPFIRPVMVENTSSKGLVEKIPIPSKPERMHMLQSLGVGKNQLQRLQGLESLNVSSRTFHEFGYTIVPDACRPGKDPLLLIYIHSAPDHFTNRMAIRETWGNSSWYHDQMGLDIRLIFCLALPTIDVEETEPGIKAESEEFRDILQENFEDSYYNLTYKAVGALRWITKHCEHIPYILKTDDDIYMNMPMMLKNILKHKSTEKKSRLQKNWFFCRSWRPKKVDRHGKWGVSEDMYPKVYYPNYCQGAYYGMTYNAARTLYLASVDIPFLWVDDAFLTGVVRAHVGIYIHRVGTYNIRSSQIKNSMLYNRLLKRVKAGTWANGSLIGYRPTLFQGLWKATENLLGTAEVTNGTLTYMKI